MVKLAARLVVVGAVVAGTAVAVSTPAGAASEESRVSAARSGTVTRSAAASREIWAACGFNDDKSKIVRIFHRKTVRGFPGGRSALKCGTRGWGYRHIKYRHMTEWQNDASLVVKNWRSHADWAISWVLKDPHVVTHRASNDTFCFSRKIYLVHNGKVVATRRPHVVVARRSRIIITAFPANKHCK